MQKYYMQLVLTQKTSDMNKVYKDRMCNPIYLLFLPFNNIPYLREIHSSKTSKALGQWP